MGLLKINTACAFVGVVTNNRALPDLQSGSMMVGFALKSSIVIRRFW